MTYDFAIIGGGIAGVSAAAKLAPLGSVLLLEGEETLGHHSSARSAAVYEKNYGHGSTLALAQASEGEHIAHDILTPRGIMVVGDQDQSAALRQEAEEMEMQIISPEEARAHMPILNARVALAGYTDAAKDLDTDRLQQTYLRIARRHGAMIRTNAPVRALRRVATGWEIHADEVLHAHKIVNAAGAWADTIAVMAGVAPLGITPLRRSMARIPAPDGMALDHWPMCMGVGEAWYCKPDAGALLVSPAEEDPQEPHDAWADDMVLAEGLARYQDYVTPEITRLISSWAGLRSFAPDRQLVLGPDAQDPEFIWCAGQGGYGFITAPAASDFLAQTLSGTQPDIGGTAANALLPKRFSS